MNPCLGGGGERTPLVGGGVCHLSTAPSARSGVCPRGGPTTFGMYPRNAAPSPSGAVAICPPPMAPPPRLSWRRQIPLRPPPHAPAIHPQGVLDFPSSGFVLCSFLPRLVHGFPEQAPPLRMEIHVRRAGELHRSGMTHKKKNWSDPDTDALKPPPSAPRQMCPMLPYPSCAPKTSPHPLEAAAKPHEHTASTPRQHPRLVSGPCHPKCAAPARHLGRCTTRRRGWLATVAATRHRRSCRRQACHPPQRSKRRARR